MEQPQISRQESQIKSALPKQDQQNDYYSEFVNDDDSSDDGYFYGSDSEDSDFFDFQQKIKGEQSKGHYTSNLEPYFTKIGQFKNIFTQSKQRNNDYEKEIGYPDINLLNNFNIANDSGDSHLMATKQYEVLKPRQVFA